MEGYRRLPEEEDKIIYEPFGFLTGGKKNKGKRKTFSEKIILGNVT